MKQMIFSTLMALGLISQPALALDASSDLQNVLNNELSKWVEDATVLDAIRKQNNMNGSISDDGILALDEKWRSEFDTVDTPFQTEVMSRPVSAYLSQRQSESNGIISEVFVMDRYGLNVGQSGLTSDYWQGDEAKFQETYPKGAGATHTSEVELDESTGQYLIQVSATVTDPESGEPIGAVTYGINIGLLE